MKITDLKIPAKFQITESRKYLYEGLDDSSRNSTMLWESAGNVLVEYNLSADQINQIFAQAEQGMTGQGANRTLIGKGKDATKAVSDAYSDLKTKISNSKPVKDFDQKVSDQLSKIGMGAKDPQFQGLVSDWVQKYRDFASAHPIAQGAIYATLVAVAGLSGAGVAGAAALGLLKSADKLLQGERFSSAAYSGAKTGAVAGAAGAIGNAVHGADVGQGMPEHPSAASDYGTGTYDPSSTPDATGQVDLPDADAAMNSQADIDAAHDWVNADAAGKAQIEQTTGMSQAQLQDIAVSNDIKPDVSGATAGAGGTDVSGLGGGQYTISKGDNLGSIAQANGISTADLQGANPQIDFSKPLQPGMNLNLPPSGDNAGSVWQGYQGGNYGDATTSATTTTAPTTTTAAPSATTPEPTAAPTATTPEPAAQAAPAEPAGFVPTGNAYIDHLNRAAANGIRLRESLIDSRQTARTWMLRESLGKARGGVVLTEAGVNAVFEGVMDWLRQKGKNLTTKVTADKLKQAWIKAKMPNDSEAIAKLMTDAGVGQAVIGDIFQGLGIPTTTQPGSATQSTQRSTGQAAGASTAQQTGGGSSTVQQTGGGGSSMTQSQGASSQQTNVATGGNQAPGAMDKLNGAADAVTAAMRYGKGAGAAGHSLAPQKTKTNSTSHTMYDKSGKAYQYTKRGDKWYDAQGGEVNPAFAQSIEGQLAQQQKDAENKAASAAKAPAADAMAAKRAAGAANAQAAMTAKPGTDQAALDRQSAKFGLPPGSTKDQLAAAIQTKNFGKTAAQAQADMEAEPAAKAATPDFSKALMGQNTGYGKATYNVPTGASPTIRPATPGATNPAQKPAAAPATASNIPKIQPATPGAVTPSTTGAVAQPAAPLTDKTGRVSPAAAAAHQEKVKAAWAAQHPGVPMPVSEGRNFSAILWKQMRGNK